MNRRSSNVTRWTVIGAVFIAASLLGGLIKIPSPVGSIALDSAPGYFVAVYIHPVLGGIVGAAGHLASAATGGFILGHVHLWVAAQMFVWCAVFGLIGRLFDNRWMLVPASLVAIVLNGVVGPLMLGALGVVDMALAKGIVVILTVASAVNVGIASVGLALRGRRRGRPQ